MLWRSHRTELKSKTELLVILTPHVVRTRAHADGVLAEESRRMDWILGDVLKSHGTAGMGPIMPVPPSKPLIPGPLLDQSGPPPVMLQPAPEGPPSAVPLDQLPQPRPLSPGAAGPILPGVSSYSLAPPAGVAPVNYAASTAPLQSAAPVKPWLRPASPSRPSFPRKGSLDDGSFSPGNTRTTTRGLLAKWGQAPRISEPDPILPTGVALALAYALLLLSLVAGCVPEASKLRPGDKPRVEPVAEVAAGWQPEVFFTADSVNKGATLPGLVGRVYLSGPRMASPWKRTAASWCNCSTKTTPGPMAGPSGLEQWELKPPALARLLRKDRIGWGYTLFLPWGTSNPGIVHVRI